MAQPRVIVRTLPGHPVLLRPPRFVATGQLRGDDAQGGISGIAKLAMKVILLAKASRIK